MRERRVRVRRGWWAVLAVTAAGAGVLSTGAGAAGDLREPVSTATTVAPEASPSTTSPPVTLPGAGATSVTLPPVTLLPVTVPPVSVPALSAPVSVALPAVLPPTANEHGGDPAGEGEQDPRGSSRFLVFPTDGSPVIGDDGRVLLLPGEILPGYGADGGREAVGIRLQDSAATVARELGFPIGLAIAMLVFLLVHRAGDAGDPRIGGRDRAYNDDLLEFS